MKFKELREKFQKGFTIPHLVDPSPTELVRFMKNKTKYDNVRVFDVDGTIYAWDGYLGIHYHFAKRELFDARIGRDIEIRANFDPNHNDEGTRIGEKFYKNNKDWVHRVFAEIETAYGGYIDRDDSNNDTYGMIKFRMV